MDKYNEIKVLFEKNKNEENAEKMSAYMRNIFPFYGIPTPKRKAFYKDLLKAEKKTKKIDWDFLDKCWEDEHREFQYVAIDYLLAMQKFITFDDIPHIKKYIKTKQWWDSIDNFDGIVGNIAFVDNRINDLMLEWSKDEDFWLRRLAIDHQLGRKDKTDKELLEKILTNNFGSNEFFINKAIGWSLRDYSKVNPEWVKAFIEKYKDKMDKLSIKEASKYIKKNNEI
ncbi:DNA alkylation repair protein [Clostridium sp. HCS.1]|uniref:DNA alkylation repair protein n=1 Tax=Clostridium sp. HCS.1 TaxID=3238594 RepID=UPI003A10031F